MKYLFNSLAVQKTKSGKPLTVFWDNKCLNDGKNWKQGFIHGLQQSQAIVLLLSHSVWLLYISSLHEIIETHIWRTSLYTMPKHIANVIVRKKFGHAFVGRPLALFPPTITFVTCFGVMYWHSCSVDKFWHLQLSQ